MAGIFQLLEAIFYDIREQAAVLQCDTSRYAMQAALQERFAKRRTDRQRRQSAF